MYLGASYLTEAGPSLGQNETDSGTLTYILVCLLWKVIFLLITSFLKADFSKQRPGVCNLQDSSAFRQDAPPSSPSDVEAPGKESPLHVI